MSPLLQSHPTENSTQSRHPEPDIHVFRDSATLFHGAAETFAEACREAVKDHGHCSVALAGGSTPRGLYRQLATEESSRLPWPSILWFWGDERHVPPNHPDSNFRMAWESFLSKSPIPPSLIHRIPAEDSDADAVARRYEETLREVFQLHTGQFPRFDVVLLGMGTDGHTASLFPGNPALREKTRLVLAPWVQSQGSCRITLSLPVLNHAASIFFLVSGKEKAPMIEKVLREMDIDPVPPARLVKPLNGKLSWFLDEDAAEDLKRRD